MISENCIFCDIVSRKQPAYIIYEDSEVMAFMDHAPVELGHVLVIPKDHFENIFEIDEDKYRQVLRITRFVSIAVKNFTGADGININQNNGRCANQRVMHYHVHVIPRFCSRNITWERKSASRDEMLDLSTGISRELSAIIE
jgi:histidine triad (HIT) family protein